MKIWCVVRREAASALRSLRYDLRRWCRLPERLPLDLAPTVELPVITARPRTDRFPADRFPADRSGAGLSPAGRSRTGRPGTGGARLRRTRAVAATGLAVLAGTVVTYLGVLGGLSTLLTEDGHRTGPPPGVPERYTTGSADDAGMGLADRHPSLGGAGAAAPGRVEDGPSAPGSTTDGAGRSPTTDPGDGASGAGSPRPTGPAPTAGTPSCPCPSPDPTASPTRAPGTGSPAPTGEPSTPTPSPSGSAGPTLPGPTGGPTPAPTSYTAE